jgi:hypothetical protein
MPSDDIAGIYNFCDSCVSDAYFSDRCKLAGNNAGHRPIPDWEAFQKALMQSLPEKYSNAMFFLVFFP